MKFNSLNKKIARNHKIYGQFNISY